MFKIDRTRNKVSPLQKRTMSELGFRERENLQQWIVANADMLGEDLLIIQEEFDGWDKTSERLDLLAVDKKKNLVVIENKRDNSGRDVIWQSLKYAAYCSTLKTADIVEIYQRRLTSKNSTANAKDLIAEFLGEDDFETIELNDGKSQRIILVAGEFPIEVTATCLWLREHQIDLKCVRVVPYGSGDDLFLNVDQIIPPPEAEEYMVKMSSKNVEEKAIKAQQGSRHKFRKRFWEFALEKFRNSDVNLFDTISPGIDSWLASGSGWSSVLYSLNFLQTGARVELYIGRRSTEENKKIYDILKRDLSKTDKAKLIWDRGEEKISSKIYFGKDFNCLDENEWPEIVDWMIQKSSEMHKIMQPELDKLSLQ